MMKSTMRWMGVLALLSMAGCSSQNLSGTYMARDDHGAALLQLTESQSQQVMGSMVLIQVKPNGQAERTDISITGGTVDANGHSLVLTMKANELLSLARNVSGQVSDAGIDLAMPGGNAHFSPAKSQEFDATINALVEVGKQRRQLQDRAKQIAEDVKRVSELTQALSAYNTRILSSTQGPEIARHQEEQLVEAARKDHGLMQDLEAKHQDYPAGQVRFRIGQLAFQMGQIKFQVDQVLQQGSEHLSEFDKGLANSPCSASASIDGCDRLAKERQRYATTRAKVESNLAQLSNDIQKNEAAIDAINKQ
ncbi:hypothetical protein ASG75_13320 [Rhodanobacter sp. Soil772]|uniref:hypothetical protein n=1 Tax=Rhodanobacter sp. Soil772 TaxID=1736406 RepID=UPI0006F9B770|nr:hypothetical protein [Rhodanobacter sp. Soil772]KRE84856.1 hypothetical protein ASG75_13320 [Rhodanobacter sp. Soil772]